MSDYCFAGKIIQADLSDGRVEIRRTNEFDSGFWGGRGFNQSLLLDFQREGVSPFDPESVIIFGAGRLVGTGAPCAVRLNIDSQNVFTGGIGSSNLGGRFARELKLAGFDHVIVSGKSEEPVYLWIDNDEVELRDASALWGKRIAETDSLLGMLTEDEDYQFVAIGPAGENRVWASAIIERNSRAGARCGLGAIMGGKKLKAIVVRGERKNVPKLAHPKRFSELTKRLTAKLSTLPSVKRKRDVGTIAAIAALSDNAAMPVRNFVDDFVPADELRHYLAEEFEPMLVGHISSCTPCPINCQHLYQGSQGDELRYDKLEANTVLDFGPRLGLTSAEHLLRCHALCTQYGLDIDNTASVICWATDCFDKGILSPSDTDGLILRWGDPDVVFKLLKKIALREGIGELLSEGSRGASVKIGRGSEDLSITIKGQDLVEPIRSCKGWALGVVVSPRGGTHTRGAPQTEFHRVPRDTAQRIWGVETAGIPQEYNGKAELVIYYEALHAAMDSLGLCYFATNWSAPDLLSPEEISELCFLALGEDISEEDLMAKGERIACLEKIYNLVHTNFDRKDDYPPEIFMKEPIKSGPFKGEKLDKEKWDAMLTEYYSFHGWDPKTSFPEEERLKILGLEKYINVLENKGKIG